MQYTVRAVSAVLSATAGVNAFASLSLSLLAGDVLAIWGPSFGAAQAGYDVTTGAAYRGNLASTPIVGGTYSVPITEAATILAQGVY